MSLVWQSVSFVPVGEGLAPPANTGAGRTNGRVIPAPTAQTPVPRRGDSRIARGHRRETDKRAVEGASPYGTDPPFPRRGRRPRRPALPPPPGEVAATVPRKAADGRGRRRGTDIRAVEGASPYGADRRLPVGGDSRIARGHRRMTHIRAGTSPAPTAQTPVPRRGRRPAHGRPRLASPSGGGVSGV